MRFSKEQARLRAIMKHRDRWVIRARVHSNVRYEQREITQADVEHVLTYGQVTDYEVKLDEIVRVEGRDKSGRRLTVVAALRDYAITVKVITVWETGKRRGP